LLAYIQDGEIIVADVTGGVLVGTTQLTQPGVNDGVYDMLWSPVGPLIAFVSATGGDPHIFVADSSGATPPVDLGLGGQPNWSPDGTHLAYVRSGNIWLTAVDNPQPAALTDKENWGWGRPIFTPAGDALVVSGAPFEMMGAQGNTEFTFSTLPLDGSGSLTPLPGQDQPVDGRLPYDLRFSPDGQKLAFFTSWHLSACQSAGAYYVLNADGGGLTTMNSPSMTALLVPNKDITYIGLGFAWKPGSDGLLITSLVIDCTDFAGTQLGAQLSSLGFDQQESVIAAGYYSSPSLDRSGSIVAVAQQADQTSPSEVILLATNGNLVLDIGAGQQPAFQP
jgi:dipeptidyl aminopeptidase/acylaminoacyl peptidase